MSTDREAPELQGAAFPKAMLWVFGLILICGLVVTLIARYAASKPHFARVEFPRTGGVPLVLVLDHANTTAKAELGLMGRPSIPDGSGMVFPFRERIPILWMKNCQTAMDMVFVGADGTIQKVLTAAVPTAGIPDAALPRYTALGPLPLSAIKPKFERKEFPLTLFVVELPPGYATRQGIAEGQKALIQPL